MKNKFEVHNYTDKSIVVSKDQIGYTCSTKLKENAELIVDILNSDDKNKVFDIETSKRGSWIRTHRGVMCTHCKVVHKLLNDYLVPTMFNSLTHCPVCGANMSNNSLINVELHEKYERWNYLKIPKYIEESLQIRANSAARALHHDLIISDFCTKHNIDVEFEDVCEGCEVYAAHTNLLKELDKQY